MKGALVVLAPDLVLLVPSHPLNSDVIAVLGRQWRSVAADVRLMILAEPLDVVDFRSEEAIAELAPRLRDLVDSWASS